MLPREPRALRVVVGAACAYEVAALTTGQVPTISRLANRHPAFGALVVGALAWHFHPGAPGN